MADYTPSTITNKEQYGRFDGTCILHWDGTDHRLAGEITLTPTMELADIRFSDSTSRIGRVAHGHMIEGEGAFAFLGQTRTEFLNVLSDLLPGSTVSGSTVLFKNTPTIVAKHVIYLIYLKELDNTNDALVYQLHEAEITANGPIFRGGDGVDLRSIGFQISAVASSVDGNIATINATAP